MADSRVIFDIIGNDKASGAFNSAGRGADTLGSKVSSMGKAAGAALAIGAGAAALFAVKLGTDAVAAARESAKITAITEQTIKSMGGAAGLTATQVADMSTRLSNVTGVDDEVLQAGANLLLTFGNISAKGGVFDRTLALANDMSIALGQDMKASSIQLGKALNDPIAGVSALTRVGVSFTAQQKEQIKTLVESGDVLGAQNVILAEVGKQFGGAAAAASTPIDKLKVTVGNLQEEVGARLIPVIDRVATFLAANLPAALDFAGAAFARIGDAIALVRNAFETGQAFIKSVLDRFRGDNDAAAAGVSGAMTRIAGFIEQARATFVLVFDAIKVLVSTWVAVVTELWDRFGTHILEFIRRTLDNIRQVFGGVLQAIQGVLNVFIGVFTGDWSRVWDGVKGIFGGAWDAILGIGKQALNVLNLAIGAGMGLLSAAWSVAWDGIKTLASNAWEAIKMKVAAGVQAVVDFIIGLPGRLLDAGEALFDAGKDLAEKLIKGLMETLTSLPKRIGDFISGIKLPSLSIGDGPGALTKSYNEGVKGGSGGSGGSALNRVKAALTAGTYVTSTYRTPAQNAAVGGSPTSYHLDKANPATDIGGSTAALDLLYGRLKAMGGWRELLWRVKGHYDHLHVAHEGGHVTPQGITPLRRDELLTKLQVGETVLPKDFGGGSPDPDDWGRRAARAYASEMRLVLRTA